MSKYSHVVGVLRIAYEISNLVRVNKNDRGMGAVNLSVLREAFGSFGGIGAWKMAPHSGSKPRGATHDDNGKIASLERSIFALVRSLREREQHLSRDG